MDDGYENTGNDNTDASNRGNTVNPYSNSNTAIRQSKSANGARSLTRKNQQ